jgi:hypothetical protein
MSKRIPIRVNDRFEASDGTVWIITECGLFGRPYWIVSEDRNRQTCMSRASLERMKRL